MNTLLIIVSGILWMTIIPIVMTYRLLPIEGTPYFLFALLFLFLVSFTLFSLHPKEIFGRIFQITNNKIQIYQSRILICLFISIFCIGILFPLITAISDRHRVAPVFGVHDVLLQQEEAMKYLRNGKNPYKETYFGTFMEEFHYSEEGKDAVNPALYHFVMPPTYLLLPFTIAPITSRLFGYFDGRMLCVLFIIGIGYFLYHWYKNKEIWMISMSLLLSGSMVFDHIVEGRSDLFALFFIIISFYFLDRKKYLISSFLFGLGIMTKQTVWFAVPFYITFIFFQTNKNLKKTFLYSIEAIITSGIITLPFLIWDYSAFVKSVISFPSGGTIPNYPISGYGIGMILQSVGIISNIHEYFPFTILQGLFGIPVLIISIFYVKKSPTIDRVFLGYGVTLFIVWYMSRYFNNNHILFIGQLLILGMTKMLDQKKQLPSNIL
jgi:hypothetical protein